MLPKRLSRHRNPSAQWLSLPQQISLRRRNHTTARAIHRVGKISSVLGSPKSHGTGRRSGWDPRSGRARKNTRHCVRNLLPIQFPDYEGIGFAQVGERFL